MCSFSRIYAATTGTGRAGTFPQFTAKRAHESGASAADRLPLTGQRLQVKMQFPVMGHIAGKRDSAAVAEAVVNLALRPPVLCLDDGNAPSGAGFSFDSDGP